MEPIRLLTCRIENQLLALPLDQVREVIRNIPVSSVASWTGLLHGIINVRGMVVPVLDLRILLGQEKAQNTRRTRIVLVDMLGRITGLVVDQVDDIVPLSQEQIVPSSALAGEKKSAILVGVAKVDNRLYLMLDIKQLIHEEERNLFRDLCLHLSQQANPIPPSMGEGALASTTVNTKQPPKKKE